MKDHIISQARDFAKQKHIGQLDDIGLDYFETHIRQVVSIILYVTKDPEVVAAAYLHDTVEDTNTTETELRKTFGDRVTDLVMEVTHEGQKDEIGYYFPRLQSKDAILIKFADRLSNLSRMDAWSEKRQQHYLKKSRFWKTNP